MNMPCSELTEIFKKIGGRFECDYETRKCVLYPNKVFCNISKTGEELDDILYNFVPGNFIEELPINDKNIKIDKIHHYQEKTSRGFVIKMCIDKNGEQGYCPCKKENNKFEVFNILNLFSQFIDKK